MSSAATAMPHVHRDPKGAKIGMWLFLFTELLLFGGLFLLYAVYRYRYPADFHYAATHLDTFLGTVNTLILLTSSLTMALSIATFQQRKRKLSAWFLVITIVFGFIFLINKYIEWSTKIHHHIYPNSPELVQHTPGENIFYSLYYAMTGLHGLHVIIGIILLTVMCVLVARKPRRHVRVPRGEGAALALLDNSGSPILEESLGSGVTEVGFTLFDETDEETRESMLIKLENAGLYWHLIDIIWIFLFPLFYLIT
ncbi:MAG TPA: cytochrome c oxidase subunit 3 [Thermoanaerobaculia bacterium]|nr:cytochrome c oxidase subunit 3 [Thermoanaerobaculia bacterium]HUM30103.1 cytochrome c oxidase subunit 3 [Thermoanaerobaculia bacterium]HXK68800.1 cytochrome c oxidase subunit 3 [Thermoanaerobaculia bacterium]